MYRYLVGAALAFATTLFSVANAAPEQEHFFDSKGVKIRYWLEGEGEPVLLIHGYSANGSLNWRAPGIQQDLSKNYQVIMPDVRGHGRSAAPENGKHGVEVVHDMVRLLDYVGVDSAHVVGYSMGGMIAIKLATMFPERVRSVLVGGMGWIKADSEDALGFARSEGASDRFAPILREFGEFGTTEEEMQALSVPLRVIIGTDDPGQMRRVGIWKEIVPTLDVVYVDGATHAGCIFRPELKEGIREFIDLQARNN